MESGSLFVKLDFPLLIRVSVSNFTKKKNYIITTRSLITLKYLPFLFRPTVWKWNTRDISISSRTKCHPRGCCHTSPCTITFFSTSFDITHQIQLGPVCLLLFYRFFVSHSRRYRCTNICSILHDRVCFHRGNINYICRYRVHAFDFGGREKKMRQSLHQLNRMSTAEECEERLVSGIFY